MDKAATPAPAPVKAETGKSERSYLTMVTMAFWAGALGLGRAYRGETQGWVRFWIFVAAYVTLIIPFLNILSMLAICVLTVWGVIDFFLLYKTKTDATGKAFVINETDAKWAKTMWIVFIVLLALSGLGILLSFVFMGWFMAVFQDLSNIRDGKGTRSGESSHIRAADDTETRSSNSNKDAVLKAYETIQNGMTKADVESKLGIKSTKCSESDFGYKLESCTYGNYKDGYTISLSFKDGALLSKSKYSY